MIKNEAKKAAEKRAKFQEQKPLTPHAVTFQPDGSKVFQLRSSLVAVQSTLKTEFSSPDKLKPNEKGKYYTIFK